MDLLDSAVQWLVAKLLATGAVTALVSTRVYRSGLEPETAAYPLISILPQAAVDVMAAAGSWTQFSRVTVLVRAMQIMPPEAASYATLRSVATEVYTALHRVSGAVGAGTYQVAWCERESTIPIDPERLPDGTKLLSINQQFTVSVYKMN